jgi:SSS family solute:Na+ symporter
MVTAFCMSVFLYLAFPAVKDEYLLVWIVLASVTLSITVTALTKPVENKVLRRFIARVKPFGFWKGMVFEKHINLHIIKKRIIMWVLGVVTTFSGMFSIGYFLRGPRSTGLICFVVSVICFWLVIRLMSEQTNDLEPTLLDS